MWTAVLLACCLLASACAEDAAKVVPEEMPGSPAEGKGPGVEGQGPGFEGQLPTPQQLLDMLDSMTGITEEEKATLREDLLKNLHGQAAPEQTLPGNDITMQAVVLLSLLGLVALVFVFFGYKLFKCLSEREKKREEKKKNKQMKKKK